MSYIHDMLHRQSATARSAQPHRPAIAALWLILAVILGHALLPVGSPLSKASGSAFSAATFEVSLAPSRGESSQSLTGREGDSSAGLGGSDPPRQPAVASQLLFPGGKPALDAASKPGAAVDVRRPSASTRPYAPRAPPIP